MKKIFSELISRLNALNFIEKVREKYHFDLEATNTMKAILNQMCDCIIRNGGWDHRIYFEPSIGMLSEVVITLGDEIDILQDEYQKQEKFTEAYMIETMSSEALLLCYHKYNNWVSEHTPYNVFRYVFPEGDDEVMELPEILERLDSVVICNSDYCMIPKKSVVFRALLTKDKTASCEGICFNCSNTNCPNRTNNVEEDKYRSADIVSRPFSYGYERIFQGKLQGKLKK